MAEKKEKSKNVKFSTEWSDCWEYHKSITSTSKSQKKVLVDFKCNSQFPGERYH